MTPGAVLPARELEGDLLFVMGRYGDALEAYEACLRTWPRRFNSLLGAARAAARGEDSEQAAEYYSRLLELTGDSDAENGRSALQEARAYLDGLG